MKTAVQLSLLFSLVVGSFAGASGQETIKVSARADWIAGLQLKKLRESSWEYIPLLAIDKHPKVKENIQKLDKSLGFHPWRDIDQITLYGTWARKTEGVVLVQSSKNLASMLQLINKSEDYRTSDFKGHTVHHWQQAGPANQKIKMACCFYQPRLAVFCRDSELLKESIEVLDGSKPQCELPEEARPRDDAIFWVFLRNLQEAPDNKKELKPYLDKMNFIAFYAGESSENTFAVLCLSTKAREHALEFSQVALGMRALARLSMSDNQIASDLINAIKITDKEKLVKIEMEQPSKKLQGYLAALIAKSIGKGPAKNNTNR